MGKPRRKRLRQRRTGAPAGRPPLTLETALERAQVFLRAGQPDDAIATLEPLQRRNPRHAPLLRLLGDAYLSRGDLQGTCRWYEQAFEAAPDDLDLLRATLKVYAGLEMALHALSLARRILALQPGDPLAAQIGEQVEATLHLLAEQGEVDLRTAEEAAGHMERGRLALGRGDYREAVSACRRAGELLPRWPVPLNNLATALSFLGEADAALAQVRTVLEIEPENIHALSSMVRFLVLAGRPEEARPFWERLRRVTPQPEEEMDRVKAAEAAAFLEEDQEVYRLLSPSVPEDLDRPLSPHEEHVLALLAPAASNLGRWKEAIRYWEALAELHPEWIRTSLHALQSEKPGLGWSNRYPYFTPQALLPAETMHEVTRVLESEERLSREQFRSLGADLARRFPQFHYIAEFFIWVQQVPEVGVPILRALGTPRAVEALHRYATSQAGPDEGRQQALAALMEMGALAPSEAVRMWLRDGWRDVTIETRRLTSKWDWPYAPELQELMDRAVALQEDGRDGRAERLYEEILRRYPTVKEACCNLSVIYSQRQDYARAEELARQALELDPLYVLPRCNLAQLRLDEGNVEAAKELLAPLIDLQEFRPQDMVLYQYVQARILVTEEQYEAAEDFLDMALRIDPDHGPSRRLKAMLELSFLTDVVEAIGEITTWQRESYRRLRRRVRKRITTLDPPLGEALSAYPKESLLGMAASLKPGGSFTALRKGELITTLQGILVQRENLIRAIRTLRKKDRHALRAIVSGGGVMSGALFGLRYGDDEGESLRWQYQEPESVLGRLRVRGLVVEGESQGETWILVPLELRSLLDDLLG